MASDSTSSTTGRIRTSSPIRRSKRAPLSVALAVALSSAAVIAGCGSSSAGHAKTASHPAVHKETYAEIVSAVDSCRQGISVGTWLSKADKESLYKVCDNGLKRGLTEIKGYAHEVCNEVAFTSPAKTAAEKARIYAACDAGAEAKTASIHP
jgi:hypothetical protein